MPSGLLNPETSEALITAPVVALYSPIVPLPSFVTHRFPPDTAMPSGPLNPETSEALTTAPVVALYSPIVPLPLVRDPQIRSRHGDASTGHSTLRRARRSPPPPWWRCIHQSCRWHRSRPTDSLPTRRCHPGHLNPETSEALTAAPVVALYSPIVPLLSFVTHRFPPDTAMPVRVIQPRDERGRGAHPVIATAPEFVQLVV